MVAREMRSSSASSGGRLYAHDARAGAELENLLYEVRTLVHGRRHRWLSIWFTHSFWTVAFYRLDRFCFLALGRMWPVLRTLLSPAIFLVSPWIGTDIPYRASIGKGLRILHSNLGVVVSENAVIGENCVLVGGNCIGSRPGVAKGSLRIGNDVTLGANAVVLAPSDLGDNVTVGAGAVVLGTHASGSVLVGVPARPLR